MKITTVINSDLKEPEIVISCPYQDEKIRKLEKLIMEQMQEQVQLEFYKEDRQFYININDVIFFET